MQVVLTMIMLILSITELFQILISKCKFLMEIQSSLFKLIIRSSLVRLSLRIISKYQLLVKVLTVKLLSVFTSKLKR